MAISLSEGEEAAMGFGAIAPIVIARVDEIQDDTKWIRPCMSTSANTCVYLQGIFGKEVHREP